MIFKKPTSLTKIPMRYCPGCGHGIVHRLVAEVIDEMGLREKAVAVVPVGCAVFLDEYFDCDAIQASHGRAPAVATGLKRSCPGTTIFTYQGDGDLAAIGTAETVHAAARGENFLIVFINNGVYGMTSGQMAPTTLPGMVTTTSPFGRDVKTQGHPLKIANLVASLPGAAYVTRQSVHKPVNVRKAKKTFQKAFEYQKRGLGTCLVEIVSNCPSNWKMTPLESNKFVEDKMIPFYPLGDLKVPEGK